jgi:hypothetical protein
MSKKDIKIKESTSWNIVEECLAEKTASGYKMAMIEAEKILQDAIKKAGYPGKTNDERIATSSKNFSNIRKLKKAREISKTVLSELNYSLNSIEVEEAAKSYHQAVTDIEENPDAQLGLIQRFSALINYYIPSKKNLFLKSLILIISILLFIVFLADTKPGQNLAKSIVSLAHFAFSWVLTTALLVGAVVVIVTITILYFENKRKGRPQEYDL